MTNSNKRTNKSSNRRKIQIQTEDDFMWKCKVYRTTDITKKG